MSKLHGPLADCKIPANKYILFDCPAFNKQYQILNQIWKKSERNFVWIPKLRANSSGQLNLYQSAFQVDQKWKYLINVYQKKNYTNSIILNYF